MELLYSRRVMQLTVDEIKLRILLYLSQFLVNTYLEMLLGSSIHSQIYHIPASNGLPSSAHQDLLTRVNDDIQLIVSSIEEFRSIVMTRRAAEDSTHYVAADAPQPSSSLPW